MWKRSAPLRRPRVGPPGKLGFSVPTASQHPSKHVEPPAQSSSFSQQALPAGQQAAGQQTGKSTKQLPPPLAAEQQTSSNSAKAHHGPNPSQPQPSCGMGQHSPPGGQENPPSAVEQQSPPGSPHQPRGVYLVAGQQTVSAGENTTPRSDFGHEPPPVLAGQQVASGGLQLCVSPGLSVVSQQSE